MKFTFVRLVSGSTAVLCAGAATYLAANGNSAWFVFLVVAFLLAVCD